MRPACHIGFVVSQTGIITSQYSLSSCMHWVRHGSSPVPHPLVHRHLRPPPLPPTRDVPGSGSLQHEEGGVAHARPPQPAFQVGGLSQDRQPLSYLLLPPRGHIEYAILACSTCS